MTAATIEPKKQGPKSAPWSEEEESFLECVARAPNLYRLWRKLAIKKSWPLRSRDALKAKIKRLGEKRKYGDESSGWLTATQLLKCLGLSDNTEQVHRWEKRGLRTYRDNDQCDAPNNPIKIHMADFVKWTLDRGLEEIAHAIRGDQLAMTWLLRQIADWKDEINPAANWMRPSPGKRQKKVG